MTHQPDDSNIPENTEQEETQENVLDVNPGDPSPNPIPEQELIKIPDLPGTQGIFGSEEADTQKS